MGEDSDRRLLKNLVGLLTSKGPGGTLARRILPFTLLVPATLGYLRFRGEQAGIFTPWFGVVLMAVSAIVVLSSVTTWTALTVQRADHERSQSIEALRLSQERLRLLLDAIKDCAIFLLDPTGRVLSWNSAAAVITGYSVDEVLGKNCSWFFAREDLAQNQPELELKEAATRGHLAQESLRVRKDGSRFWAHVEIAPLYDSDGKLCGFSKVVHDLTEHKQAEQAVRESEERYRSLAVATAQIVWTTNANGEVAGDMPMWREFTGQSREEIQGWGWINSLHPDDRERTAVVWSNAVKQRALYEIEYRMRRHDGEYRHVWVRGVPVIGDDTIREWVGTCTDITERKRAEEQLRLSQERLSLALKAGQSGTFDWDIRNNVNIWSPEVEELYGLAAGEFGGKYESWEELLLPEDLEKARAEIEKALSTGEFVGEWRIHRKRDGEIRWLAARAKVSFDEFGQPVRMMGINVDITERRRAEEEVRKLNDELEQRVQARTAELQAANRELEAFTYSVSHDLRAPLRHIAGFSKILVEEYGPNLVPAARHYLQRVHEGTTRMGLLVDDLLNLARVSRQELHLQVAGLNSIVEEVRNELLPETEGREVEWKIGKLPFVECDPALLRQVFQNLLSNALKFTRPRSPAVIEVGVEEGSAPPVIFVRDNGVGFSMKYADKLFGVFQRLHRPEDFEGTGVGLATVQRIIKKHAGGIWAEAELDRGAKMRFTLGAAEHNQITEEKEAEPEAIMAGVN